MSHKPYPVRKSPRLAGYDYAQEGAYFQKLWQRSFHDHIIRDEARLAVLRQYVLSNPARWEEDTFYNG